MASIPLFEGFVIQGALIGFTPNTPGHELAGDRHFWNDGLIDKEDGFSTEDLSKRDYGFFNIRSSKMVYVKKAGNKARRLLARVPIIYSAFRKRAVSARSNDLPSSAEALEILRLASPRPPRCELPRCRDWPIVPEVEGTFIVPCYNAAAFLDECIESILEQRTERTFEVIAIDDGSTDNTGLILERFAARDERLRVVHQENRGFSGARNTGISLARGGVFLFVDSDDTLEPDAFEVLMSAYDEGGCDFVTANFSYMSQGGTRVIPSSSPRTHGAPWSRVYSREIWRNLEFPEGFWFEDTVHEYCISSMYKEHYVEQPLYRYRKNGKGISMSCVAFKKGLDTFWVVGEMLEWCRDLGVRFDQALFDQTVRQLGPLMRYRTAALERPEKEALFVACCDLLASVPEFGGLSCTMGGRWDDLLLSLRTRNFQLWKLAVFTL